MFLEVIHAINNSEIFGLFIPFKIDEKREPFDNFNQVVALNEFE